jgi:cyanate permease
MVAVTDPVRARRARAARLASIGQRAGYVLFGAAAAAFFVGLARGYSETLVLVVQVGLVVGSAVLAPSIVLAYAVRAAERDDQEHGR